jgi:hypothetical protein
LSVEWDFGGGAMERPKTNVASGIKFVRNNGVYRVRFTAFDAKKRYCEASINVTVGTPPSGLNGKVSEQTAPSRGSQLSGIAGQIVVLPFEEWTYQNLSDMRMVPNGYGSFSPTVNNFQAHVYQKDRLPVVLGDDKVTLNYSAASNPADPAGAHSINSTSRNWPLSTSSMVDAVIQKTDMWELPTRTDSEKASSYVACTWAMTGYWGAYGCGNSQGLPVADEGYFKAKKDSNGNVVADDVKNNPDHGRYMPGKANPYVANDPQAFPVFNADSSRFTANLIPRTDIDDQGKVNPFGLMRVQAIDKTTNKAVSTTDGVVTVGKDFHCRECHAKGQVAANPNSGHTAAAFSSSAWGAYWETQDPTPASKVLTRPEYFDVSSFGGNPNNIDDQEYAAALNYSSTHQFYDNIDFLEEMLHGNLDKDGKVTKDTPRPCYGCHATAISFTPFNNAWWDEEGFKVKDPAYAPSYSISMHRFHGELQWKDDNKTDIVRDAKGAFQRWDWKTNGPNNSTKTRSLFPIFDGEGKQLPMEENCLKCHSGHREQMYRDRMYTAGVSCFDCHGDMLAVGEAFPKNYLTNKSKIGSTERDDYRVAWFDEPNCASCHIGDGNKGKDKANGYFSDGILKTAFDLSDWSATTRAVDNTNANSNRFAVAPIENYKATFPTDFFYQLNNSTGSFDIKTVDTKVDAPVFRYGKDAHGNVACAACHGAAHSVWPNRDPKANDNVTALQLQGHTGTILECNVCHTADAFKNEADLDGGRFSGDTKAGILGGPHNTHPINDPNWWKVADTGIANADGTNFGGWHNNYAKKSGKNGEDQCAACHGNDHKGTRLSKTPVDRVFDFSGLDFAKLKKAGFKSKVIKVTAGSVIGCDTCHKIELSCTSLPAGNNCGKP